MKLTYEVRQKVPFGRNLVYAFQQVLAIIAATVLVPALVNVNAAKFCAENGLTFLSQNLSQAAALIGAGVGTLVYLLFTKFKSPVFLGSSFAFIAPLSTGILYGYCGIIIGSIFAGLVYVIIALVVKKAGTNWLNKLMPPVIIGPTVALIGLSLSGSAMNNLMNVASSSDDYNLIAILVGVVTFLVTIIASVKGNKTIKLIPFVIGVGAGYLLALIFTLVGIAADVDYLKLIDFTAFKQIADFKNWLPDLSFVEAIKELGGSAETTYALDLSAIFNLFVAFAPVAMVVFAEHVADHKNISSIIEKDLLKDPGLHRTLLGDGVGSIAGAVVGGCPNTTYGESIGCVAITGNASVYTIFTTAIMCIVLAFVYPVMLFIESIPSCVVGGICIALYGFIAVSGLRMFKNVDLDDSKNLFIVAAIFVTGLGGLELKMGPVTISSIACALILGIIVNLILKPKKVNVNKSVELCDGETVVEDMFGATVTDNPSSKESTSAKE